MLGSFSRCELKDSAYISDEVKALALKKTKFTVSVEGNIGSGKSTLLRFFENYPSKVECLQEPVELWTNLRGHNPLQKLYEDPHRWGFSFNTYAQLTRLDMHSHKSKTPVKMLERSLYSTRYCFVENAYRNGIMTDLEYAVLCDWFDMIDTTNTVDISVDLFVYLRASPEVSYERIKKRNRKEEKCVPFELIQDLHNLHEEWLIKQSKNPPSAPVLILDAENDLPEMLQIYEKYKSDILCGQV